MVNTVHDSIVIDVHPEEESQVLCAIKDINYNLDRYIKEGLNVDINVPLLLESKIGNNWLDIKDVA